MSSCSLHCQPLSTMSCVASCRRGAASNACPRRVSTQAPRDGVSSPADEHPAADTNSSGTAADNTDTEPLLTADQLDVGAEELLLTFREYYECAGSCGPALVSTDRLLCAEAYPPQRQ